MKLRKIIDWVDTLLETSRFDDVSNNGLQLARTGDEVCRVAFAVDASVASVRKAIAAKADLLVVHHGISWGGGIRRLTGGEYNVVKAALDGNLAIAAWHLPLDANRKVGNNWEIARALGLARVRPAFSYHGNIIGVVGKASRASSVTIGRQAIRLSGNQTVGVCSGGAGSFAADAQALGCDLYVTGEADWGEVIAAENVGMPMLACGHYETETFGVKALARAMKRALKVATVFVSLMIAFAVYAAEEFPEDRFYAGAGASLLLPQGGADMDAAAGGAVRFGWNWTDAVAVEAEAGVAGRHAELAARGVFFWHGWDLYDRFFGFSRADPFLTLGAVGWFDGGTAGPAAGLGALYYLSDHWAWRFDAEATLGLDGDAAMVYALGTGLQCSF